MRIEAVSGIIEKNMPLMYLMKCAVLGVRPETDALSGVDFDAVLQQSEFHGIAATVAAAVCSLEAVTGLIDAEQQSRWSLVSNNAMRRYILTVNEIERVCAEFDRRGLRYVRLKGSKLAGMYPRPEMRGMSDVDLLIDRDKRETAKEAMEHLGYEVEHFGNSHHDVFVRAPIYNFEIHNMLFWTKYEKLHSYFEDVQNRLIPSAGGSCECFLSDADFYLFLLAHACKHLHNAGTGLRMLADLYIVLQKIHPDAAEIESGLSEMGIEKDERILRSLARKLFESLGSPVLSALSEEEENVLAFILRSGINGTYEQEFRNKMFGDIAEGEHDISVNRRRYLKSRVFPKPEEYREKHPFFYRHRLARPALPLVRLGKYAFKNGRKLKSELSFLRKMREREKEQKKENNTSSGNQ